MSALAPAPAQTYSSRLVRSGSLLADSRIYLREWDDRRSARENLIHFREVNVLAKRSRSRADGILAELRRRFPLDRMDTTSRLALLRFVKEVPSSKAVDKVLAYHAAKSDPLLYDFITAHLSRLYALGERHVTLADTVTFLREAEGRGPTTRTWSRTTLAALARGLLAAAKDFGLLSGRRRKVFASPELPLEAFLYVMYRLRRHASGHSLLMHRDWRLFLLRPNDVEELTAAAARRGLLSYQAVGRTASLGFPYPDLEVLLDVIAG